MKNALLFTMLSLFIVPNSFSQGQHTTSTAANKMLALVHKKLSSFNNVQYDYKRELNYSSENYHNEMKGTVYLDFASKDTLIGFKYQLEDETLKSFFNGTEKFELNKKAKSINVNHQPKQSSFQGLAMFYNSIVTLRNALPAIIADENILKVVGDTTINTSTYSTVTLTLHSKSLDYLGKNINPVIKGRDVIYKIIIEKDSHLPIGVLETNNVNNDFKNTSFTNIAIDKSQPSELSWFYSTYTDEYKPAQKTQTPLLIAVGSQAPEWTLPLYNTTDSLRLSSFKGKLVLLDFWIKNCGPCIESVPHLNSLQQNLKNEVEVVGINAYDTKDDITWFCNKHKPNYKILSDGKDVAEKYGVGGFPSTVLIGKDGNVLYSGAGLNKDKIEALILKQESSN